MFPTRHGKGGIGLQRGEQGSRDEGPKTWAQEMGDKKRGWLREPKCASWMRDSANKNCSTGNSFLNKAGNNLWSRRTNSTNSIPDLTSDRTSLHHSSSSNLNAGGAFLNSAHHNGNSSGVTASPATNTVPRGSSSSPRALHSKGFWVQEPEDSTQRWMSTETPDSTTSPLTWPPSGVRPQGKQDSTSSQPPSPSRTLVSPPIVGSAAIPKMSPGDGETSSCSGGSGDVLDFNSRVKRYQNSEPQQNQQIISSSRTSQRSQMASHSMTNINEQKTTSKSDLSELKSSMSEFKSNISEMTHSTSNQQQNNTLNYSSRSAMQQSSSSTSSSTITSSSNTSGFNLKTPGFKMGSVDALNDALKMNSGDQLTIPEVGTELSLPQGQLTNSNSSGDFNFEEKKSISTSSTKVVTDKNSYEAATGQSSESRKLQAGGVSYEKCAKAEATKAKMEVDGVTAEKASAMAQECRQIKAGDVTHREGTQVKGAAVSLSGEGFCAQKSAMAEQQQKQTVTPAGSISSHSSRQAANVGLKIKTKDSCTKSSASIMSSQNNISISGFEGLNLLSPNASPVDIQNAIMNCNVAITNCIEKLRTLEPNTPSLVDDIKNMIQSAWAVPTHGHELGYSLCNVLRSNGGLELLIDNCASSNEDVKFSSAKVIEQCLTTENRDYVVDNCLDTIVNIACECTNNGRTLDESRVGTGILEHLFKHSEGACSSIIKKGGLAAVLHECKNNIGVSTKEDVETLRHCASALANLSLFGGCDNQHAMIENKVASWLFPLAFHTDDYIKYYACLAIASLVANKEIEAEIVGNSTLELIEPFVSQNHPEDFANSSVAHCHGQSKSWLERLVPVLSSKRQEARNLAAFHFCMEAGIKKKQGNLEIFREIGAIEPLKVVASSPNAIASKYAGEALEVMGIEKPHKLSQKVPVWTPRDVSEWVKQIHFEDYSEYFENMRVDGDLLLQIKEDNLKEDFGICSGIQRKRFLRELKKLKQMSDYSNKVSSNLHSFLIQISPEFGEYTYQMVQAGVTTEYLRYITDEQLAEECGIFSSIHRQKIRDAIQRETAAAVTETGGLEKTLDAFISYRRSNGSQLASLLKVYMDIRQFSAFIDVDRLEAGKFDNNLLKWIRKAKNFLLVLTPYALDRCIGDSECKDWVHREIVTALESGCNIIPIFDNFQFPESDHLPQDMRAVCAFNGVKWIHDYQDACVEKLERFMRGECNTSLDGGRSINGELLSSQIGRSPLYQRTQSIESGKFSSCSEKDGSKE